MSVLLEAKSLYFSWDSARNGLINSLNLSLHPGHIYGLVGRNGAGKTTLIKLLSGALRPRQGDVRLCLGDTSYEVASRLPEALAEVIYVPETLSFPDLDALSFARFAGRLYPRFSLDNFRRTLEAFEIPTHVLLPRLSFGQGRKVHIAFALATDARLIFLDEPSNGLDIAAQISLRRMLIEYLSPERSVVVSTHHVQEFEHVIDRVIVMDRGCILVEEALEVLQAQPGYRDIERWYAELIGLVSSRASSSSSIRTRDYDTI
jgi:ABC-2 type transport system ATP-binding protein